MRYRWNEADLARVNANIRAQISAPTEIRRKYKNKKVRFNGLVFDSQHELDRWKDLKLQEMAGDIRSVVRQVSFALPGCKRRIRLDHMIVRNDGQIVFEDAKGFATPEWKLKRDQVEQAYGIKISTV